MDISIIACLLMMGIPKSRTLVMIAANLTIPLNGELSTGRKGAKIHKDQLPD